MTYTRIFADTLDIQYEQIIACVCIHCVQERSISYSNTKITLKYS